VNEFFNLLVTQVDPPNGFFIAMLGEGWRHKSRGREHLSFCPPVDAADLGEVAVDAAWAVAVIDHDVTCLGKLLGGYAPSALFTEQLHPFTKMHDGFVEVDRHVSAAEFTERDLNRSQIVSSPKT